VTGEAEAGVIRGCQAGASALVVARVGASAVQAGSTALIQLRVLHG
jgi:hypothetical protein